MGVKKPTAEDFTQMLYTLYDKSKNGLEHISPPIEKMSYDYLSKYEDKQRAVKAMLKNQIAKCTTSGIVTGFGGMITLPITIPANIGSVLYVQMRMVACTAHMAGYDLDSDQVQTFVYACLVGVSVNELLKSFGMQLGEKLAVAGIKKIPGAVLIKINQRIGFRMLTKFGEKGIINLGKMVPVVGAVINGGLDFAETKLIANRAYHVFVDGDLTVLDKSSDKDKNIVSTQ